MLQVVAVMPKDEGWAVRSAALEGELTFSSGGRAEAAARRLAERLADHGEPAEIRLHKRDGALVGRFLVRARQSPIWNVARNA